MQVTCQWWSWSACCCSEMSCQCLELTRWGIGLLSPCRVCSQAGLRCWIGVDGSELAVELTQLKELTTPSLSSKMGLCCWTQSQHSQRS